MPTEMQRAVGLFSDRQDAEAALSKLRGSGFDMNQISVVNKGSETGEMQGASVNADKDAQVADSAARSATVGGVSGGAIGLIGSLGVLAIPGVGPAAGLGVLLANTVFAGAIGAAGGGALGALVGWGLPDDQAQYYSDRVNQSGDYLVLVEGDTNAIQSAQTILQQNRINDWRTFSANNASTSTSQSTMSSPGLASQGLASPGMESPGMSSPGTTPQPPASTT